MIKQLFNIPALKLQEIDYSGDLIRIYASIKSHRSKCPLCGRYSKRVHDYYYRTITDLPVFQNKTVILLRTRKFICGSKNCHRKVFSEQTPDIIRYSRRTGRVSRILETFAIELTGRLGSILTEQLHISVSSSTITRIAHGRQLMEITQPRVLGVDDWAYRKGVSYGTILIDMETSRPIELLPSRDGQVLKDWLLKYNDVRIITRDRASSYALAINEACPNAVQVADRFHLLMNLSDALDTYFKSVSGKIRSLIASKSKEFLNLQDNGKVKEFKDISPQEIQIAQPSEECRVDQRLEIFNKVKELQVKEIPVLRISKDLGINRKTVQAYFLQETLAPRTHPKSSNIELFTDHIVARLSIDGYIVNDIIKEITGFGYNGSRSQAYNNINSIKKKHGIKTSGFSQIQCTRIPFVKPLSSRKLAKHIGSHLTDITDHNDRHYLQTLLDNIIELRIVRKLVQIFKEMLARGLGNIRRWIDFIIRSKRKLSGLKTFARGMLRDIEAVENGINMHWSNGAVEGHVNRIKSIKRQMYDRASFELLRKKVILSQSG